MIGYLRGKVRDTGADTVLLEVNGVGYRVFIGQNTLGSLLGAQEDVELFIHTYVREDALRLYGFESKDSLWLFEHLIRVSGIGPKIGLAALGRFDPESLLATIANGDSKILVKIPGVGKKTAERIVLELGDALRKHQVVSKAVVRPSPQNRSMAELADSLRYLGYQESEIREVVQQLEPVVAKYSVPELVKRALKLVRRTK